MDSREEKHLPSLPPAPIAPPLVDGRALSSTLRRFFQIPGFLPGPLLLPLLRLEYMSHAVLNHLMQAAVVRFRILCGSSLEQYTSRPSTLAEIEYDEEFGWIEKYEPRRLNNGAMVPGEVVCGHHEYGKRLVYDEAVWRLVVSKETSDKETKNVMRSLLERERTGRGIARKVNVPEFRVADCTDLMSVAIETVMYGELQDYGKRMLRSIFTLLTAPQNQPAGAAALRMFFDSMQIFISVLEGEKVFLALPDNDSHAVVRKVIANAATVSAVITEGDKEYIMHGTPFDVNGCSFEGFPATRRGVNYTSRASKCLWSLVEAVRKRTNVRRGVM